MHHVVCLPPGHGSGLLPAQAGAAAAPRQAARPAPAHGDEGVGLGHHGHHGHHLQVWCAWCLVWVGGDDGGNIQTDARQHEEEEGVAEERAPDHHQVGPAR